MKHQTSSATDGGFIRAILLIIVALLILSYFGLNIREIVNSPAGRDNFSYTQELMIKVWEGYLKKPVSYVWNDVFIELIWEPAIDNLKQMRSGEAHDIQTDSTQIQIE